MVNKQKFIEELKELIEKGEIKATWEGLETDIIDVSINEKGLIVLDVNEY